MKVLIADDDEFARRLLQTILSHGGYETVTAAGGEEAWAIANSAAAPEILLIDWMMPDLDGPELCRRLRQNKSRAYILLVTSKNTQKDVLEGLGAGADDFVNKPLVPEELLARLRVAQRVLSMQRPPSERLVSVLREAAKGQGGEVVVREGDAVGRIFLHQGRIAWAHLSTEPDSLGDALAEEASLSRQDMRELIEECRRTGKNFGEALVEWGLLDRARLRARLQAWIARKLDLMLKLPSAEVVFLPQARDRKSVV